MTGSPTQSPQPGSNRNNPSPDIPVEIITDEEMAFIEAALASAATATSSLPPLFSSSCSSSRLHKSFKSIKNAIALSSSSNRNISRCRTDVEDMGKGSFGISCSQQGKEMKKKNNGVVHESFLNRFRRNRGLSVTDLTAAVVKRVKVEVQTNEDVWALKFMNFVIGVNQLVFDGLTRELPLIGFTEGVWIVGVIDEIRMPKVGQERFPTIVDTKTRVRATLPAEPQRRNGRLQLMCYKHLWDSLVGGKFPSGQFFEFFSLNPKSILSAEIRESTAESGFPAETLDDIVKYYTNTCCTLSLSNDQLLLRYELQEDQSLIGEDQFAYDPDWLKSQIKSCLEFWNGDREPRYATKEERWKCRFCKFNAICPVTTDDDKPN